MTFSFLTVLVFIEKTFASFSLPPDEDWDIQVSGGAAYDPYPGWVYFFSNRIFLVFVFLLIILPTVGYFIYSRIKRKKMKIAEQRGQEIKKNISDKEC